MVLTLWHIDDWQYFNEHMLVNVLSHLRAHKLTLLSSAKYEKKNRQFLIYSVP
jgi:hypothetical protein